MCTGITEVGANAREINMFRGAVAYGGGNAFTQIGAAKKAGKGPLDEILTIQSSESESESDDDDAKKRRRYVYLIILVRAIGMTTFFFVNRRQQLDPSEHWASVPGQAKIAGMDHVLDAADDFKMGAGSHMGKAERTALLAPDVHPIAPGKKSAKEVSLF